MCANLGLAFVTLVTLSGDAGKLLILSKIAFLRVMSTLVTEVIEEQLTHMCLHGFNEGNGAENTINNSSSFGTIR